jgi:hypothetical protein
VDSAQNLLSSHPLSFVLYRCETWPLLPRENHRFIVSVTRMLRGMFGTKGEEVTGGWIKLHNESAVIYTYKLRSSGL